MRGVRRFAGYLWASPATVLGLLGASLALWRGRIEIRRGVVEAHGPALRWTLTHLSVLPGGIAAITLGHVILARDARTLHSTRAHERVHVRQYERWGLFMVPAYVLASAWGWARGKHFYFDNPFERQAFGNHEGGLHRGRSSQTGHYLQRSARQTRRSIRATKDTMGTRTRRVVRTDTTLS